MRDLTEREEFIIDDGVSHIEIASVNYDQWILTVAVRIYGNPDQKVVGITHIIFDNAMGFRLLDEGDMLGFPWPDLSKPRPLVHRISSGGWYDLENNAGNLVHGDILKEYVIVTGNECVSVLTSDDKYPTFVPSAC